jgi:hypothetical protein
MPISKILEPRVELPELTADAQRAYRRALSLSNDEKDALIKHLRECVRSTKHGESVDLAPTATVRPGDRVEITGGALDHIGDHGVVNSVGRARIRVTVAGKATPLYLFMSDIRVIAQKPTLGKRDSSHLRAVPKATDTDRTGTTG